MIEERKVSIEERVLHFKQPAGTSRGVYTERKSWFVTVRDGDRRGVGECAPLPAPAPLPVTALVAVVTAGFIGSTTKASRWMNYIGVSENEKMQGETIPASSISSVRQCKNG